MRVRAQSSWGKSKANERLRRHGNIAPLRGRERLKQLLTSVEKAGVILKDMAGKVLKTHSRERVEKLISKHDYLSSFTSDETCVHHTSQVKFFGMCDWESEVIIPLKAQTCVLKPGSHLFFTSFTAQLYCTPTICECFELWSTWSWVTLAKKKTSYSHTEESLRLIVISIMYEAPLVSAHSSRKGLLHWRQDLCPSFGLRLVRLHEQRPGFQAGTELQAWLNGRVLGRVRHSLISFISCTIHLDFYLED